MLTLRDRLKACAKRSGVPSAIVPALLDLAPWLDGSTEVSPLLASELLSEPFASVSLGAAEIERFVVAYNDEVRSAAHPHVEVQDAAYAACLGALAPFGTDCERGGRDFWVFPESFADNPSIVVFPDFTLPQEAIAALHGVAKAFANAYSGIDVITEEGDLVVHCPSRAG